MDLFSVRFGVTLLGSVKITVRHARMATPARNCFGMRMLVLNRGTGFPRSVYCAGIVGEPRRHLLLALRKRHLACAQRVSTRTPIDVGDCSTFSTLVSGRSVGVQDGRTIICECDNIN